MMKRRLTVLAGPLVAMATASVLAQDNRSSAAEPSAQDQAAVYDTVLASWLGEAPGHQLINDHLSDAPSKADRDFKECAKAIDFSKGSEPRPNESLAAIPLHTKGIEIIDGSQWTPADPGRAIANGEAVDTAVKEGFAHSLISFSRISFSGDGKDALVKFAMVCGSLCGSGSTIHLHKRSAEWKIIGRCGNWVS